MENKAIFELSNPVSKEEANKMHPMALAFIGDAVQSLYTRTMVSIGTSEKTGPLHEEVTKIVKAVSQSKTAEELLPSFTEEEHDIFRRARNCKIQTSAKHAKMDEYRRASGFEAVLGFLYITGQTERLTQLLEKASEVKE
ncbi:MAG: Mini-ribonuclease 3 [Clostridia bacterium]|nr:Mini-ribonuclease 3 [Clostridia bacterium]